MDSSDGIAGYTNQKVHIEGMDTHAAIFIDIRGREEIPHLFNVQPCLFLDFATHPLFYRFIHITEATWQVEGSLGRFLGTTHHQQLIPIVHDEGCRCRTGIGIIGKAAVTAALAFEVVNLEMTAATDRTELKFL